MVKAAQAANMTAAATPLLATHYAQQPSIDVLDALSLLEAVSPEGAATTHQRYLDHLGQHVSLMAAARWLSEDQQRSSPLPPSVQKTLEQAVRPLARYRCAACGFEAKEHFWHCPGCQAWDSYPPRRIEEL